MIEALKLLDKELEGDHTLYICGGAAVSLIAASRPTADVDVIEPEVSGGLLVAAKRVASSESGLQLGLRENWLNDSVGTMVQIAKVLPKAWKANAIKQGAVFEGKNLVVFSLDRIDLLRTKLLAIVSADRGADSIQDIEDICNLGVTVEQVLCELDWLQTADKFYDQSANKTRAYYESLITDTVIEEMKRRLHEK